MTFIVTVNSTDPIWFYCSLDAHCIAGMVGVVNPPAGQTVSDYVENASGLRASAPVIVQGGVLTTVDGGSGIGSGSVTSTTVSSSSSMSRSSSSVTSMSGSSSGVSTITSMSGSRMSTSTPSLSAETTMSTSTGTATTTKSSNTASGVAATSTPSGGGKSNDASVMLGLGVLGGLFVALMA